MNAKQTAFLALAVTAFCATILGGITATPEIVTQIIIGVVAFLSSGLVLLGLWFTSWFRNSSVSRQQSVIWISTGSTSAIVCFLPLALWLLVHKTFP